MAIKKYKFGRLTEKERDEVETVWIANPTTQTCGQFWEKYMKTLFLHIYKRVIRRIII